MSELLDYLTTARPFEEAHRKYGIQTVAFFVAGFPGIARELASDANWRLTYLDPMYAVFLRADGPNAEMARRLEITPRNFDANRLIRKAREWDPVPAYPMHMAACTLYFLGWDDLAIDLFHASLKENADNFRSWEMLGECLAGRGQERLMEWVQLQKEAKYSLADEAHRAGLHDWLEAREDYLRAQSINPNSIPGSIGLANIRQQLKALEHGEVLHIYSSVDRALRHFSPQSGAARASSSSPSSQAP
jgi:tetratricopeptide (TPR) repeat protein